MGRAGTYASRRERQSEAMELFADGVSITAIARRLGIRLDYATRLVRAGLAALPEQDVDELRAGSEVRLDRIAGVWSELLNDPDPKVRAQAAEGLRRVESDRARLLGTWQKPPKED